MAEQPEDKQAAIDFEAIKEVKRVCQQWVTAFVERDTETLNRVMADDFVFTYPMEGDDKTQFISDVESGDLTIDLFDRKNVVVRIYGDSAVLTCHDTARWTYHGRLITGDYRTLQVYARRQGRWQLVAVQSCPLSH
ncbi:MAG TPA: nuclear transport factor 2 family protein [Pyrinomonadaceae bacterium]